jgi:hypothetical protein
MRNVHLRSLVSLLVLICGSQAAPAQKIKAARDPDSADILSVRKARNIPNGDFANKIEKDGRGRKLFAESPQKIRQAFVICVPSGSKEVESCVQRVFVTDLATDETYEISGEELFIEANRPVDGLRWVGEFVLSYERWTSPHFGHRYVVDLKRMKQTGAFVLTDR